MTDVTVMNLPDGRTAVRPPAGAGWLLTYASTGQVEEWVADADVAGDTVLAAAVANPPELASPAISDFARLVIAGQPGPAVGWRRGVLRVALELDVRRVLRQRAWANYQAQLQGAPAPYPGAPDLASISNRFDGIIVGLCLALQLLALDFDGNPAYRPEYVPTNRLSPEPP